MLSSTLLQQLLTGGVTLPSTLARQFQQEKKGNVGLGLGWSAGLTVTNSDRPTRPSTQNLSNYLSHSHTHTPTDDEA